LLWGDDSQEVLLMDADLGLANLDAVLGLVPRAGLGDVTDRKVSLPEACTPGPAGISVLSGSSGHLPLIDITSGEHENLKDEFFKFAGRFDRVLIDLPAGLSGHCQAWLLACDVKILVVTPDPTSLLDAYATAKMIFAKQPEARVGVVVNRAETMSQGREVSSRFQKILGQFLQKPVAAFGVVRESQAVRVALRNRKPVVLSQPTSTFCQELGLVKVALSAENHVGGQVFRLADFRMPEAA
jgi:flagellar biosynthesis protein FlhG